MKGQVFHCSPTKGISSFAPRAVLGRPAWVYASPHLEMAAAFFGRFSNIDMAQWGQGSHMHLVERYRGAFQKIYSEVRGSLYVFSAETFEPFNGMEAVSLVPVQPIKEIDVPSAWEFLESLVPKGNLSLYKFPNRPSYIPEDDSDIVEIVAKWIKADGGIFSQNRSYMDLVLKHLHLKSRLDAELEKI
jgi:hypothetical protein